MKGISLIVFILICSSFLFAQNAHIPLAMAPDPQTRLKLHGFAGEKINVCIQEQIMKQDVEHLTEPFRFKNETWGWQTEFWGKWMLSAAGAYDYTQDEGLGAMMEESVKNIIETQLPNGYIGNYGPENQLTAWDIWGRKYTMLGLMEYYRVSGYQKALDAARKVADHLMSQVGPDKVNITETGFYRGMASSSILEPMVWLFNYTGDQQYLDFAEYIVSQWDHDNGPGIISKALQNIPVSERFPAPENWWSWENGQKAYEMMSCYDGLLQLYLITGKKEYLEAVKSAVQSIMDTEINIAGSGSAFECWYHGIKNQTRPTYHTMETCVTTTWMKLCQNLLQVTGDPIFADQIEKSFYNALLASMKYDGSQIAKYSPLAGIRQQGEEQCGMHINCCNANGPRGFVMMPKFALMQSKNTIYLNFYSDMTADLKLPDGQFVKLKQTTSYPDRGFIYIEVSPVKTEMELVLRIPSWSKYNTVEVNDQVTNKIEPGSWYRIKRTWENGGVIRLNLDLHGRLIEQDNHQAIMRGPLLLARDTRFDDGPIDEAAVILHDNGFVNLQWPKEQPPYVWKTFVAQLVTGTDLEGSGREPRDIRFCDFASAGNMWNPKNRYRVWIPKTLNVMKNEYKGY